MASLGASELSRHIIMFWQLLHSFEGQTSQSSSTDTQSSREYKISKFIIMYYDNIQFIMMNDIIQVICNDCKRTTKYKYI